MHTEPLGKQWENHRFQASEIFLCIPHLTTKLKFDENIDLHIQKSQLTQCRINANLTLDT